MALNPQTGEYSGPQHPFGIPDYFSTNPQTRVHEDGTEEIVSSDIPPEGRFQPDKKKALIRGLIIIGLGYAILKGLKVI